MRTGLTAGGGIALGMIVGITSTPSGKVPTTTAAWFSVWCSVSSWGALLPG
jgi:hypothetical protein